MWLLKGFFGFVERAATTVITNPFLLFGLMGIFVVFKLLSPGERDAED